jgi:hypothetical protein
MVKKLSSFWSGTSTAPAGEPPGSNNPTVESEGSFRHSSYSAGFKARTELIAIGRAL